MRAELVVAQIMKIVKDEFKLPKSNDFHVVDLSYQVLKLSDPQLTLVEHKVLLGAFQAELIPSVNLSYTVRDVKDAATSKDRVYFVNDPVYGQFVIGTDYSLVQSKVAKVLQQLNTDDQFTGIKELGLSDSLLGPVTPLSAKAMRLIGRMPLSAAKPIIQELDDLYSTHNISTSFAFSRSPGSEVLGAAAIMVTLQSAALTSAYASITKNMEKALVKFATSSEFIDELITSPKGYSSFVEDIAAQIVETITDKPAPKNKQKPKDSSAKATQVKVKPTGTVSKLPPTRDRAGKFYSLNSLQVLLDLHLADQIKRNMGDGTRKDVLNYRSGRFASSAKVDRLVKSKSGLITAFYSYMKYPYQTFEPGFRQGSPTSRNPKLLISKSIREIAAKQVANRLRAVPS